MVVSNPTLAALAEITTVFFLSGLAATRFTDAHSAYVSTDPAKRITLAGNIVGGCLYVLGIFFMITLIAMMYENNCEKEQNGDKIGLRNSRLHKFQKRALSKHYTDGEEDIGSD
jgi:hypothetical protein